MFWVVFVCISEVFSGFWVVLNVFKWFSVVFGGFECFLHSWVRFSSLGWLGGFLCSVALFVVWVIL